ncbi:hypothetical protein OG844_12420 [Streptomyces sp. NBC_00887]|nr:hypothetical protein OG844_12420 [Streptomyces sp. NBC_00887]
MCLAEVRASLGQWRTVKPMPSGEAMPIDRPSVRTRRARRTSLRSPFSCGTTYGV